MRVEFKKLVSEAKIPHYAHPGDAGMDLSSTESLELKPGQRAMVATGLAMALPEGYAAFVQPRSGLAAKHGISIVNTPGLIDSGYRGELKVILINTDTAESFQINPGDRIAQLVIIKTPEIDVAEVEMFSEEDTQRGAGGFGSSGV